MKLTKAMVKKVAKQAIEKQVADAKITFTSVQWLGKECNNYNGDGTNRAAIVYAVCNGIKVIVNVDLFSNGSGYAHGHAIR